MDKIFIDILNLSITASYIIIAVMLLKLVLHKAPKWISCLLWSVVGLRLAFPFSIESILSLIPSKEPIPSDIAISPSPHINTGLPFVNKAFNPVISESFTPDPVQSANPLQTWIFIGSIVWIAGICAILLWGIISFITVKRKTIPSIKIRDNIYICDNISSPFILGIIKPKIYLPSNIGEDESSVVIEHEKAHISRLDHIWKPIGFVLLSAYWFNPLVWLAYIILCRDIEKACDQKVIKKMSDDSRRIYSQTLLSYSENPVRISACPLAFGEVGVKSRVKSILSYKKPAFWIIIVAVVLLIVTAVVFLTYPKQEQSENTTDSSEATEGETTEHTSEESTEDSSEDTAENMYGKITDDMVPSPAQITGVQSRMLFLPIDGKTYRYTQTSIITYRYYIGDEIFSCTYESGFGSGKKTHYVTVYTMNESDLKKVYVIIDNNHYIYEYAPPQACAPDALEKAIQDGYTVTEGLFVTHGADEFHDFYDKTSSGVPAELKLAKYYTIGKNLSEELYEATKEDYPQIYYSSVKYDGKVFTVGQEKEYKYIHKFTEVFPEHAANPGKTYNVYALTNVENVTWQDIQYGFFSSQLGSYIDHFVLIYEFVEE